MAAYGIIKMMFIYKERQGTLRNRTAWEGEDAVLYLDEYGGLDFLEEFYDVQHTLPFADTVDSLAVICRKNGGILS